MSMGNFRAWDGLRYMYPGRSISFQHQSYNPLDIPRAFILSPYRRVSFSSIFPAPLLERRVARSVPSLSEPRHTPSPNSQGVARVPPHHAAIPGALP